MTDDERARKFRDWFDQKAKQHPTIFETVITPKGIVYHNIRYDNMMWSFYRSDINNKSSLRWGLKGASSVINRSIP